MSNIIINFHRLGNFYHCTLICHIKCTYMVSPCMQFNFYGLSVDHKKLTFSYYMYGSYNNIMHDIRYNYHICTLYYLNSMVITFTIHFSHRQEYRLQL